MIKLLKRETNYYNLRITPGYEIEGASKKVDQVIF